MGKAVDALLQSKGSKPTPTAGGSKTAAKSGSAVSALLASKGAAPASSAESSGHKPLSLAGLGHRAAGLVTGLPKGLLSFGIGAPRDVAHLVTNVATGKATEQKPGESVTEAAAREYPILGGLVQSAANTGSRIIHPTRLVRDYKTDPLGTLIEDAANVSVVGGPVAEALGKGGKVVEGANVVANAPAAPFRAAARVAGKVVDAAGESEGRVGSVLRAARLDPQSRQVRRDVLEPAVEQISQHTGDTVARAQRLEKLLPDKTEQIAATLVGEGEGSALAALRRNASPDDFDAYVTKSYGDSVPVDAARLAADVAEQQRGGSLGEREQRIVSALAEGALGRTQREAAYVAEGVPGREQEVRGRFGPLTQVVDEAARKPEETAARAAKLARGLRGRADLVAARVGEVDTEPQLAGARRSAEVAARQFASTRQRVLDTAARAKAALGDIDALRGTERARAETRWRKALEGDIRDFRRANAAQLRAQADDLMSQLPNTGPKMPGKWLDREQGIRHPNRDVAEQISQALGEGYAGRKFFTGGHGLDVYLDDVNRRLHVTDEAGSGMGQGQIADAVVSIIGKARALRREAQAVERGHNPAEHIPAGTVTAVARLGVANLADKITREADQAAAATDAPRFARFDKAEGRLGKAQVAAESAREGLNRPIQKAAAAGQAAGRREGSAVAQLKAAASLAQRAEDVAGRNAQRATKARVAAEQSIGAAPARLRPVLIRNRDVAGILGTKIRSLYNDGNLEAAQQLRAEVNGLPKTLEALKADGVDVDHFIHVEFDAKPGQGGVRGGPNLPRIRKTSQEHVREGSPVYDRTIRAQAKKELDILRNGVAKEAARKIAGSTVAQKFASIAEAREAGFVAWDPKSPFEKSGQITKTTTFIPQHVFDGYRTYFEDGRFEKILQNTWDPATRAFKVSVLALSPSWQVGNVIGNTLLATVGAGVNPARLAVEAAKALVAYKKAGGWEGVAPRRLFTSGPAHEELAYLNDRAMEEGGKIRQAAHKAGAPARASYRANEFVDNLTRSAVYTAKRAKGFSEEAAVKQALNAMGDFSKMTPFERNVVRRIVPFYAWQRHITQLAFRLPIESPARTAWVLHLSQLYGQDGEDLPGALAGSIGIPGTDMRLGTTGLNPFGRLGVTLDPGKLPQSLNPLIKIPAQSATGVNLYTNKPFTRPPGSGRHDEYERPVPTAPSLLKQIEDLSPQKRLLDALTGRDRVVRYDTGDPVLTAQGPLQGDRTSIQALARFFGFPVYGPGEVAGMQERTATNQEKEAKARAGYDKKKDVADTLPYAPGAKKKKK